MHLTMTLALPVAPASIPAQDITAAAQCYRQQRRGVLKELDRRPEGEIHEVPPLHASSEGCMQYVP